MTKPLSQAASGRRPRCSRPCPSTLSVSASASGSRTSTASLRATQPTSSATPPHPSQPSSSHSSPPPHSPNRDRPTSSRVQPLPTTSDVCEACPAARSPVGLLPRSLAGSRGSRPPLPCPAVRSPVGLLPRGVGHHAQLREGAAQQRQRLGAHVWQRLGGRLQVPVRHTATHDSPQTQTGLQAPSSGRTPDTLCSRTRQLRRWREQAHVGWVARQHVGGRLSHLARKALLGTAPSSAHAHATSATLPGASWKR